MGQGQEKPVETKVGAISDFPIPSGKRQLMSFLGMAGYYRKFCYNFSIIAEPLTNLLGKRVEFICTYNCQIKKEGKDQESIQSSTTPDPGYQWESDRSQLDITSESQEVSAFPAGDHRASTNRRA